MDSISLNDMKRLLERHAPQNPIRFHTIPRFVLENNIKLQPRSFPYNLPTGPRRPSSVMSRPPALGLGSIRGLKEEGKKELTSQESSNKLPPIKEQDKETKELLKLKETVSF